MEIIFHIFAAWALCASLAASILSTTLAFFSALLAPALLFGTRTASPAIVQKGTASGPPGSVSRRLSRRGEREYKNVAIIGGGIAGVGCAYALSRHDNVQVHIFEKRALLGGNAKTQVWPGPNKLRTGLSVLAWPKKYFHTYRRLMRELFISTEDVVLPFSVGSSREGKGERRRREEKRGEER